jgi:hypothetical protein
MGANQKDDAESVTTDDKVRRSEAMPITTEFARPSEKAGSRFAGWIRFVNP